MSSAQSDVELLSKLAGQYRDKGNANPRQNWADILKAHTLYNACASRSSAKNWGEKAFKVQKIYWGDEVASTLKEQTEIAQDLQDKLYAIRKEYNADLSPVTNIINRWDCTTANLDSAYNKLITTQLVDGMKTVSLAGNTKLKVFAGKVIQRSVQLCRKQVPCKFAAVALGSLAKGEGTPYSDLEFMFLLEKKTPQIVEYFEILAMTVYFLIGNLQETKLKYMNIAELNKFTDTGKNGFKIDGLQAKAGNIPTGNGTEEQKNKFILTVDELLAKYQHIFMNPDPEESKKGDFTSMLAHTTVIYGESSLLSDFERRKQNFDMNEARLDAHNTMIKQDVEDYSFLPLMELTMSNHSANLKSAIYRFPSLLVYNLKIIYNIESKTSWETLDKLRQMKKLSQIFYASLKFLLASALYIRLAAYLHHDSQNDDMTFVPSSDPSGKSKFWHITKPLYLHMSLHMIPVKRYIAQTKNPLQAVTTEVVYNTNRVHALVSFYANNYVDALKAFEKLPVKGYDDYFMLSHCYLSLKQWNRYQSSVQSIIDYTTARPYSIHLMSMLPYWKYKSATGYTQAGDLVSAKEGYDKLLSELPSDLFYNHEIFSHASRLYGLINDVSRADIYYNKACMHLESVAQQTSQHYMDTFKSQILQQRAGTLIHTLHYTEAEQLVLQNIQLQQKMYGKNGVCTELANSYHALGNVYAGLGQYTKSLEYQRKAGKLFKQLNPVTKDGHNLSIQDISFALAYEGQGNLEKTLEHYLKALVQMETFLPSNHQTIADMRRRIGLVLFRRSKYDEAEKYFKQSLAIYMSLGNALYDKGLARCHKEYADLCVHLNRRAEGLEHLLKATSFRCNFDDVENMDTMCEAWSTLAKLLMFDNKFEDAASSFENSVKYRHRKSTFRSRIHAMNYNYLGQCYRQISWRRQDEHGDALRSKAHRAFVAGLSLLCHDPKSERDNTSVYIVIGAQIFVNWLTWYVKV